jgi:hypothetical protein
MPGQRAWTVLVWMAGDNDLEGAAVDDLKELKKVGSTDDVAVAAQVDRPSGTRRYVVTKGGRIDDDIDSDLGETNTGDPQVAIDFFTWGIERFPSERVLAVLWNHGSGLDEAGYERAPGARSVERHARGGSGAISRRRVRAVLSKRFRRALFGKTVEAAVRDRGIGYDDSAADFLDNAELKQVLDDVKQRTGRRIDLLGFDACLMNMIEVAYQCQGVADCIVGSQELEPGDGWPYDRILKDLVARPSMTPSELGRSVVEHYLSSYDDDTITQSALDLGRSKALADAVDSLARELLVALDDNAEYKAFRRATNNAQRFDTPGFLDLVDLCSQVTARTQLAAVKDAAAAVTAAVNGPQPFVVAEGHEGSTVANANGVSIYVPMGGNVSVAYDRLAFAQDTKWGELLKAFTS